MDNYPRDDIDLLDLFQKSFNALQEVMKVVINYFMTTCRLEFTELYDFGKSLKDQWGQQFNECHLFHLTDEYGNVIPIEEMGLTETKISVDLIDWNLIFELGDDCTRTK